MERGDIADTASEAGSEGVNEAANNSTTIEHDHNIDNAYRPVYPIYPTLGRPLTAQSQLTKS